VALTADHLIVVGRGRLIRDVSVSEFIASASTGSVHVRTGVGERRREVLPGEAGSAFVSSIRMPDTLAPWTGLGVLVIWVVASLAVAAVLLKRRDS
jgi:hypothetical protein